MNGFVFVSWVNLKDLLIYVHWKLWNANKINLLRNPDVHVFEYVDRLLHVISTYAFLFEQTYRPTIMLLLMLSVAKAVRLLHVHRSPYSKLTLCSVIICARHSLWVERAWRHPVWADQSEWDVSLPHVWPAVVGVSRPKETASPTRILTTLSYTVWSLCHSHTLSPIAIHDNWWRDS
jgi:hypothetical protein